MLRPSTRFQLPDLLQQPWEPLLSLGHRIVGVEVGTDQGAYAAELLKAYPQLFLITVDPWLPYKEIIDPATNEWDDRRLARLRYAANLQPYAGRSLHLEQDSVRVARALATGNPPASSHGPLPSPPYDFVFLDAAHDYASVKADLKAWWPLVRVGGILSGHDFDMPDVSRAVICFAKFHRADLQLINEHGGPDEGRWPLEPTWPGEELAGEKWPGTGVDRISGWARPTWYWYKEHTNQ